MMTLQARLLYPECFATIAGEADVQPVSGIAQRPRKGRSSSGQPPGGGQAQDGGKPVLRKAGSG
jgi:hypothetical protein